MNGKLVALAAALIGVSVTTAGAFQGGPERLILRGTIRDFKPDHPDFDVSGPGGHFAGNVGLDISAQYRPSLTQGGSLVSSQFRDKNTNPIAPHLFNAGAASVFVVSGPAIANQSYADTFDASKGPYGGSNVGGASVGGGS